MTAASIAWRYLKAGSGLLTLSTGLSVLGMIIGVGSLVVAMSVISGYETTLKRSVIDITSHMMVARTSGPEDPEQFKELLSSISNYKSYTPYVFLEAVVAHHGKLSGVAIEGVDPATVHQVLRLKSRVLKGEMNLQSEDSSYSLALIGKGIARKHGLDVGDKFKLVLPMSNQFSGARSKPRVREFKVSGVLDLGRHDFDERYILTDILSAQALAQIGQQVSGYRFLLNSDEEALTLAPEINAQFYPRYQARHWYAVNANLFQAVKYEKPIIFFVLLVIVIAAAFNICSTLFVSVIGRFREISVLKSMGATRWLIIRIFTLQGLIIGFVGSLVGIVFGLFACGVFAWIQNHWSIMPAEVYKLDKVYLELRNSDLAMILISSWLISLLATLLPAWKGANLPPVEGLRYE